jgi:hypothetical protein
MRCLNCGGVGVVWNPDIEALYCVDCQTAPAGHEVEGMDQDIWEVPIESLR